MGNSWKWCRSQAVAVPDATATSEAQCRSSCRRDPTCANYKFHSNTCNRREIGWKIRFWNVFVFVVCCGWWWMIDDGWLMDDDDFDDGDDSFQEGDLLAAPLACLGWDDFWFSSICLLSPPSLVSGMMLSQLEVPCDACWVGLVKQTSYSENKWFRRFVLQDKSTRKNLPESFSFHFLKFCNCSPWISESIQKVKKYPHLIQMEVEMSLVYKDAIVLKLPMVHWTILATSGIRPIGVGFPPSFAQIIIKERGRWWYFLLEEGSSEQKVLGKRDESFILVSSSIPSEMFLCEAQLQRWSPRWQTAPTRVVVWRCEIGCQVLQSAVLGVEVIKIHSDNCWAMVQFSIYAS